MKMHFVSILVNAYIYYKLLFVTETFFAYNNYNNYISSQYVHLTILLDTELIAVANYIMHLIYIIYYQLSIVNVSEY